MLAQLAPLAARVLAGDMADEGVTAAMGALAVAHTVIRVTQEHRVLVAAVRTGERAVA